MNMIERRMARVEAVADAKLTDLALLTDEELEQRIHAVVERMIASRDETVREMSGIGCLELESWLRRIDNVARKVDLQAYGFTEIRAMAEAAMRSIDAAEEKEPHR